MRTRPKFARLASVCLVSAALTVACSDDDDSNSSSNNPSSAGPDGSVVTRPQDAGLDATTSPGATDASSGSDASVRLSDPEIVGVTSVANTGEITAGTLAQNKATDPRVKDFAAMMVTMHTAAQQRQTALGVSPESSTVQSVLKAEATAAEQTLNVTPSGTLFDEAYVRSQVAIHDQVRRTIEEVLIPSANSPALRAELTTALGEVQSHLTQARTLAGSL